jgi:hypothetical protein
MKTANDIFNNKNRQRRQVEVPEWGVTLKVRSLSFDRMMQLSREAKIDGESVTYDKDVIVTTILECCLNDEGEQFFTEEHRDNLLAEDFDIVLNLFKGIMNTAGSKEEAEKN